MDAYCGGERHNFPLLERISTKQEDSEGRKVCKSRKCMVPSLALLARQQLEQQNVKAPRVSYQGFFKTLELKFPGFQTSGLQKMFSEKVFGKDIFQVNPLQRPRLRCGVSASMYLRSVNDLCQTKETISVIRSSQSEQGLAGYIRSPLIDEIILKQEANLKVQQIAAEVRTRSQIEDTNNNGDIKYKGKRCFSVKSDFRKITKCYQMKKETQTHD